MTQLSSVISHIEEGNFQRIFRQLYNKKDAARARLRYLELLNNFKNLYGEGMVSLISSPGRTELSGNHTDHQNGCVLAASVDLDIIAVASPNLSNVVRISSEGFEDIQLSLENLEPHDNPGSRSLVRGVAQWLTQNGFAIGGFDCCMSSRVLEGSGLSSSAAFEVAVGQIFNCLFNNGKISKLALAIAGRFSENVHFDKPSGLMDQAACAIGGFVSMDFNNPLNPVVSNIDFDFTQTDYDLIIVDTKGSHAGLTPLYSAISQEMTKVAGMFNKAVLRDVPEKEFFGKIPEIRMLLGDRALLRAMHFFEENRRAAEMAQALKCGNFNRFLSLSKQSGDSSWKLLQNVISPADPRCQELGVALAISEDFLKGHGSCRVHGGGFAGTIQVFVPKNKTALYCETMSRIFSENSCYALSIRPFGVIDLLGMHI